MRKLLLTLTILALIPCAIAWGRNEGLSGGGGGESASGGNGGGGGYSGGGGGGSYSGSTASNDTWYHGQRYSNGRATYRSSGRTYYYNRGYRGNGAYQSSGTFHHFNSPNRTGSYGYNNYRSNVVPQNLQAMGVKSIPRPLSNNALLTHNFQHSAPGLPTSGPGGRAFTASVASPSHMNSPEIRSGMAAIAGNRTFMAKVAASTPLGGRANQYLWHNWGGYPYVTYWGGYGGCWYGWNFGGGFFWTQYYANNWWWYDPWWDHWCYWYGGGWWWQDPGTTTVYIYNNGQYTPAQDDGSTSGNGNGPSAYNQDDYGGPVYGDDNEQKLTNNIEPGRSAENPSNEPIDFVSQDGSVKVSVSPQGDAFLYKMKDSEAAGKPVYLDTNVQEVKFSSAGNGPTKILLIFKDGSFETFNADGTSTAGGVKA